MFLFGFVREFRDRLCIMSWLVPSAGLNVMNGGSDHHRNGAGLGLLVSGLDCLAVCGSGSAEAGRNAWIGDC